jgi:hypothetical protein
VLQVLEALEVPTETKSLDEIVRLGVAYKEDLSCGRLADRKGHPLYL